MAVTNGWGQGVINNTNGFGKLATNNIGAGSIYENSHSGDTALIGTSAAFSYSAASFTQADSNPTPTITGTTGGTFSGTSGLVFVSTSTGEIDLSASTIAAHVVTYTVGGVSSTFNLSVVSAPYASTSSFSFDGVNDYFDAGNTNSHSTISVSLWFKATTAATYERIIQKGNNSGGATIGYGIAFSSSSDKIEAWYRVGTTQYASKSTTTINTGSWYNVIFTYNNDSVAPKLYINGVLEPTLSGTSGSFGSSSDDLNIGRKAGAIAALFNGLIDEVSIWDSALSSAAITEIYNSGAPNDLTSLTNASSSNLKAWYKMGE